MSADETVPDAGAFQTDEDWKQRVKAEDAALDQQFRAADTTTAEQPLDAEAGPATSDPELPPASFSMLVSMFSTQAMVALGVLPNPATGKAERQPNLARHFIDLLGVLDEKTRGNLDQREDSLLESSLHQLRLLYVEMSRTSAGTK